MQHLTEEEGMQLIDEWEGECVDIQVIPLREYAEAK